MAAAVAEGSPQADAHAPLGVATLRQPRCVSTPDSPLPSQPIPTEFSLSLAFDSDTEMPELSEVCC